MQPQEINFHSESSESTLDRLSGVPNNGFLKNALKTLFRLPRVLLDLKKYILIRAIKSISVASS